MTDVHDVIDVSGFDTHTSDDFGFAIDVHEGYFDPNRVRILVYGESGSGKTVFASTWPKSIYLDIDKGMSSISKKVHRINIENFEDMKKAFTYLKDPKNHPFRTVVVDSLNELQHIAMRNIVVGFPSIRRAYNDLPSQSDYGKMLDDFDLMLRDLKSLNMNIVFISNAAPREFETDPVQPQLVGKNTSRNVARYMDVVGYLYKTDTLNESGGKNRSMVFDANNYVTKDRSGMLPPIIENPTYGKLNAFWKKQFNGKDEQEGEV